MAPMPFTPHLLSSLLCSLLLRSSPLTSLDPPLFSVMMPKSWFYVPAGGFGSPSGSGSSRYRRRYLRPSSSTALGSSGKEETVLSSGKEEVQEPP